MQTVLVADDNEDIQWLLERLLTDAGYIVLTAGTNTEVLDIILNSSEKLIVLLDLDLPGRSVFDILYDNINLRKRHTYFLFTAWYSGAIPSKVLALRLPQIPKPFEIPDLLKTLAAICPSPTKV